MNSRLHTPEGVRDIFGVECDKKRYLESRIEKLFRSYGYQSIETPTFELLDVFGDDVGSTPVRDMYKLSDRQGDLLVLRPDFTPSVARAASTFYGDETLPLRFCYRGSVFSQVRRLQGRLSENTQMGVEYLHDDSAEADAEVLSLVISVMQRAGLKDFQITIGSVPFFQSLVSEAGLPDEVVDELRACLITQNRYGALSLIESRPMPENVADALRRLPSLFGDVSVLDEAEELSIPDGAAEALARLRRIQELLVRYGCDAYVTYDLGMVTEFRYYTGIIFQAYAYGSGEPLVSGGRYDRLLERFGECSPAIGFMTRIDALATALERSGIEVPVPDRKIMLLYPSSMEEYAIAYARRARSEGEDIACIRCREGESAEDYEDYGRRNQFGRILFMETAEEGVSVDLSTGQKEAFVPFPEEGGSVV